MKNVMIFGDSYSTYEGYIPEGYDTYYPHLDVCCVEETWWAKLVKAIDGNLLENNSWSGSTIGYTGYENTDCSRFNSFIYRYKKRQEEGFFTKNKVDAVFVFGGTNDSWSNAPLGEMKFADWEEKDLFFVMPAICYFAYRLKTDLPKAEIVFVINTEIKEEIQNCMEELAMRYGVKAVRLHDISKDEGHPNKKGMSQICEQILERL